MESQEQAFHPFHRPWKSRKPGVIPTFPQLRRLLIYIRVQKQNPDLRPKPRGWAKLNCRSGPNIVAKGTDRRGSAPEEPALCGWQCKPNGRRWVPQGTRIGWVAGSDLYLEPEASYQVAQQLAGAERLAVSEQTLRSRLRECGLLVSTDVGRKMLTVRRTLEGRPRQVLHLKVSDLVGVPPR
jgi:hypothetical protein